MAAIVSLFATETAALLACVGFLIQKGRGTEKGDGATEARYQVALTLVTVNRDLLQANLDVVREIKWLILAGDKQTDQISRALDNQGKALGDAANALQQLTRRGQ